MFKTFNGICLKQLQMTVLLVLHVPLDKTLIFNLICIIFFTLIWLWYLVWKDWRHAKFYKVLFQKQSFYVKDSLQSKVLRVFQFRGDDKTFGTLREFITFDWNVHVYFHLYQQYTTHKGKLTHSKFNKKWYEYLESLLEKQCSVLCSLHWLKQV